MRLMSHRLLFLRGLKNLFLLIMTGVLQMLFASTSYHSLILKTDGSLHTFGRNDYGQLGDGTTTQRNSPTQKKCLFEFVVWLASGQAGFDFLLWIAVKYSIPLYPVTQEGKSVKN